MNLAFEWLYSVESFTMVRSFILEDVCVGILPMDLAAKHLRQRTIQNFSQNNIHFGEHRICATVLENNKDSLKIKLLIKLLKSIK